MRAEADESFRKVAIDLIVVFVVGRIKIVHSKPRGTT